MFEEKEMITKKLIKLMSTLALSAVIFALSSVFASAAICGDIDNDKNVTASDARTALRASVGLETLSEEQKKVADIDENGTVTASDARMILRMSVALEPIEHYYNVNITKEPTCTEKGEREKICTECDDKYTEVINSLGHKWGEAEVLTMVTCETDGLEKYTCTRCGFFEERVVEGGHIWNPEKATCTQDQYCTRGKHTGELKTGHSTDWGVCTKCNVFVTDKYADAAEKLKTNFTKASADVTAAYAEIQASQGAFSWLKNYVGKAKPLYVSARAAYVLAIEACADIPEFQKIKENLTKTVSNIDGILAQIDKISTYGYIDEGSYYTLVGPIDELNYINSDSIYDLDKALKKLIVW